MPRAFQSGSAVHLVGSDHYCDDPQLEAHIAQLTAAMECSKLWLHRVPIQTSADRICDLRCNTPEQVPDAVAMGLLFARLSSGCREHVIAPNPYVIS